MLHTLHFGFILRSQDEKKPKEKKIMNDRVMRECELLAKNTLTANKVYSWDNNYSSISFATTYNIGEIDLASVKEIKDLVSRENRWFSTFNNSAVRSAVAAELLKSSDPSNAMEEIKNIYEILKTKFRSSEYTAVTALIIHDMSKEPVELVDKMYTIYNILSGNHMLMTNYRDLASVALMAASDKSAEAICKESEEIYRRICGDFGTFNRDEAFVISNVLSVFEDPIEWKCKAAVRMYTELKSKKIKFESYCTATVLAPLAIASLNNDSRILIDEIIEADKYLYKQKVIGGFFGISDAVRRMLAASAVAKAYTDDSVDPIVDRITCMSSVIACVSVNDDNAAVIVTM